MVLQPLKSFLNNGCHNPAVVAWFIKAPVFHSVNSEPNQTVDPILLEVCNFYGIVIRYKCMWWAAHKSWSEYTTCIWRAAHKSWSEYTTFVKVEEVNSGVFKSQVQPEICLVKNILNDCNSLLFFRNKNHYNHYWYAPDSRVSIYE